MFWNDALDGPWTMVLGLILVVSAWLLWRGHRWGARSRRRDAFSEARAAIAERDSSAEAAKLEVRLLEFRREVEALVKTRMAALDALIADADERIGELVRRVGESRGFEQPALPNPPARLRVVPGADELTPEEREMIVLLRDAGFDAEEIARIVDQPTALVAELLDDGASPDVSDAA